MSDLEEALAELGIPAELLPIAFGLFLVGKLAPGIAVAFSWARGAWRLLAGRPEAALLPTVDDSRDERLRRREARRLVAAHVAHVIERANKEDQWRDKRYTELEAEIELRSDVPLRLPVIRYLTPQLEVRRIRSLSSALQRKTTTSKNRRRIQQVQLVTLVGAPGSGKSVALRRLGLRLAQEATGAASLAATLPIYVNLRQVRRDGRAIDANLIESLVLFSLEADTNSNVKEFIDKEFASGIGRASWVFLFDSFDEIPELLGSNENDPVIKQYSTAIEDFARTRDVSCVVASRRFRRPRELQSDTWNILPLSERRKRELVKSANLAPDEQKQLEAWLLAAPTGMAALCSTPMFLSLVCDFVRDSQNMPEDRHSVFSSFIDRRLAGIGEDPERMPRSSQERLRDVAERIALVMAAVEDLGLNPRRSELMTAMHIHTHAERARVNDAMDDLRRVKLARGDDNPRLDDPSFEFVHRRFAEYFATEVVRKRQDLLERYELDKGIAARMLLDSRWRETAVTLGELGDPGSLPLVDEAAAFLGRAAERFPALEGERLAQVERGELRNEIEPDRERFSWPDGVFHVLSLLQAGFPDRDRLPVDVQRASGRMLVAAFERGHVLDRYWAVSVAATTSDTVFVGLVRAALSGKHDLPREPAYQQVAALRSVPDDIARPMRSHLVQMARDGSLRADPLSAKALLLRLKESARGEFLLALNLLRLAWWVDVVAHVAVFVSLMQLTSDIELPVFRGLMALGILTASWYARSSLRLVPNLGALLYVRLSAAALIFSLAVPGDPPASAVEWEWVAFTVLSLAWAPAAMVAVTEGMWIRRSAWLLWPLLPFVVIPACWALLRRSGWKSVLATFLVLVGALLGIALGVIGLGALALASPSAAGGLLAVATVAAFVWLLWQTVPIAWKWWSDVRWFNSWADADRGSISARKLLQWLASQKTRSGAVRLVRTARMRQMLRDDPEALAVVQDLERVTEVALSDKTLGEMPASAWQTDAIPEWLAKHPSVEDRLAAFGYPFLDAVSRLLLALHELPSLASHPPRRE